MIPKCIKMDFMKFRFLLLPFAIIFLILASLWLVVQKGYPEKLTLYFIIKSLQKNGVSFSAQSFSGNIREGITIEKPIFQKGKTKIEADRIFVRSRRTPILWGSFLIKELKIENIVAVIKVERQEGKKSNFEIPLWLTVFAKNVFIKVKRVEVVSDAESQIFENCIIKTNFNHILSRFEFNDLSISIDRSPLKNRIEFLGNGEAKAGNFIKLKGELNYGDSFGKINISYERKKGDANIEGKLESFLLNLKDLKGFTEFPDLKIRCDAEFYFSGEKLRIKGNFDEETYGRFSIKSEGKIKNNVLTGRVFISSSPFFYTLSINEIKSDKLEINASLDGEYSYNYKNKILYAKLKGDYKESKVLGIYVSSGKAELTIDNKSLNVFSSFISPEAGKGDVEVDYNFFNGKADIRFKTSETYPLKILNILGIDVPLPDPLKFSSGMFNFKLAEILFENNRIVISMDAKDDRNGDYSVYLDFYDARLQELSVLAEKVDTGSWGIEVPLLLSGNMFFDFKKTEYVNFLLKDVYFNFEKIEIGPINSEAKIFGSGKLLLPETDVAFSFGKARIKGELAQNGFYSGKAFIEKLDLNKLDSSLDGEISTGDFSFKGDFSSINFSGSFFSDELKIGNGEFFSLKGRGNVILKDGDINLDLSVESDFLSISGNTFTRFTSSIKKAGEKGTFELATKYDRNKISARGDFSFDKDKKNLSVFLASLIFEMEKRRLYLTKKATIEASKNLISLKNFQLESGNSKFLLEGSIEKTDEDSKIDAQINMDNFSIVLIPFLNIPNALSGRFDASLSIKGELKKPQFSGNLLLRNFVYEIPESETKFIGMLEASFEKDKIITKGYLTTSKEGDLNLSGTINISYDNAYLDIKLLAQDLSVAYKSLFSGVLDAEISLLGNFNEPHIEGSINILKGRIQLKESFAQSLPESIVFIGKPLPKEQNSMIREFFRKLRGRLKIGARKKLWLVRKDLLAQISGDVLINFTKEGIQPEGKMSVDEGRFFLSGNKFDLKNSSFYFSSGKDLLPLLDIHAEKEISGHIVVIRLQGNVEKPTLTLSSTPPLEQGEILSLILFGRTLQNLNPDENAKWGGAAAVIAFNYEAAPLFNSVSKKMKFDTIGMGTSERGDPQLGFSKYLSDKLVLEYQQTFGALPESNINLKYRINRNLSIETNSSTQGHSGADIIWERKF